MGVVLLKILQVVLALAVLIVVHEAGHFTFAKLFHVRVDKFFLFFDIGGRKLLSTKTGWFAKLFPSLSKYETEYGIGWLPLGGYCKICGMVDESMDTNFIGTEPKPYELRSKNPWQRLLVMVGGVLYNFIFAVLLYITIMAVWGESYIQNEGNHFYVNELAYDMGFRDGDAIVEMDGVVPEDFGMLQADLVRRQVKQVKVLRGADTVVLYMDHARMPEMLASPDMFTLAVPFVVDTIPPASLNYGVDIVRGDRIVEVDGVPVTYVQESRQVLSKRIGDTVPVRLVRGADTLSRSIQVDTTGAALIYASIPGLKSRRYTVLQAIPAGVRYTGETIGGYLQDLKMVFTPSTGAYKSVGSFIAIGQIFPSAWDWYRFVSIMALLSIMLGVMNLLPIPGLDGGHILFILYELITRRKPSDKFLVVAQILGMVIIFGLMFLAIGNDIGRLFN